MPWVILFGPLGASAVITLFTVRRKSLSAGIANLSLGLSFLLSLLLFFESWQKGFPTEEHSIQWVFFPGFSLEFGLLIDRLALLMLLIVTGVGSAIFFYSMEYMRGDRGTSRYFASLALFAFSMLGICLSNNFVQIFIFWELVGLSSYILIGHWFERGEAADAGKKAFLVTRLGDIGFLLGILSLWSLTEKSPAQTLNFLKLSESLPPFLERIPGEAGLFAAIALLIFCGVVGKSAQFPLHVWLPDAMEGPTPVSALIHAATMVAAGVFLLARIYFLFALSETALNVIAGVGLTTAFLTATMAVVQDDIKRVLAYSTLSQLGLMVMGIGLGDATAGIYHLATHAFFKALLFLAAGSVIHTLHRQNIWEMGRLATKMPFTAAAFATGALALAGVFPLSGYWSKEAILKVAAQNGGFFLWGFLATSFLTALYIGRVYFTVFYGPRPAPHEARDPNWVMKGPLLLLAFFSAIGGFLGIDSFLHPRGVGIPAHWDSLAISSSALILVGIFLALILYGVNPNWAKALKERFSLLYELLVHKYFLDDLYDALVKHIQDRFSALCHLFERWVIVQFAVNGTARSTRVAGELVRLLQTGKVQFYAMVFSLGLTLIVYLFVLKQGA